MPGGEHRHLRLWRKTTLFITKLLIRKWYLMFKSCRGSPFTYDLIILDDLKFNGVQAATYSTAEPPSFYVW